MIVIFNLKKTSFVVVLIIYLFLTSCNKLKLNDIVTINNNMQNYGFIYKYNSIFYYTGIKNHNYTDIWDEFVFYKNEINKGKKELSNKFICNINKINKYIIGLEYLPGETNDIINLVCYNENTGEYKNLVEGIYNIVQYYDDNIYYKKEYSTNIINIIKADGKNVGEIKLKHKATNFFITKNLLFYVSQNGDIENLYMCELDGKNTLLIDEIDSDNRLIYYKEYLYYINTKDNSKIYRINIYNKQKQKITDVGSSPFNIKNNKIYFGNLDDNCKLYYMSINDKDIKKISDDVSNSVCVIDNKIFFRDDDYNINYLNEDCSVHKFY